MRVVFYSQYGVSIYITAGEEQREPHPLAGKHVLCLNEAGQRK